MRYEKSCGAVIYAVRQGRPVFLLETMRQGHVSLCKGHVEGNETERETARREIREETGLEVRFWDGFRECIAYSPYDGCIKEVVFFLACAEGTQTTPQECEVAGIEWLPEEAALRALTHASDRQVLRRAAAFLKGRTGPCGF